MNIIYVGFPGLGFQGKNLCVMFVFAIVYFLFFSEYLFTVDIVQGYNLHLVSELYWLQGDAFVVKGLARDCDKPCYSGRSAVLFFR
jgi:hypothetical protein